MESRSTGLSPQLLSRPMALLVFVTGHAADRFDRRRVAQVSQIVAAATAAFLAYGSFAGWLQVPQIFAAVARRFHL